MLSVSIFLTKQSEVQQKIDRLWKFSEIDDKWIKVKLPSDLVPCDNSKVNENKEMLEKEDKLDEKKMSLKVILPLRKRIL